MQARVEAKRREIAGKRQDAGLKHVVISEKKDKKVERVLLQFMNS